MTMEHKTHFLRPSYDLPNESQGRDGSREWTLTDTVFPQRRVQEQGGHYHLTNVKPRSEDHPSPSSKPGRLGQSQNPSGYVDPESLPGRVDRIGRDEGHRRFETDIDKS